jgi:hypothetical protein
MGRRFDPLHAVELWDKEDRHVEELIELTGDYRVARAAFEGSVKRGPLRQKTCLPLTCSQPFRLSSVGISTPLAANVPCTPH